MADEVASADGAPHSRSAGPPPPVPPSVGWAVDPFGRFSARYWDGSEWTEQILDHDGHLGADADPLRDPAAWFAAQQDAHTASESSDAAPPHASTAPPRYAPPPYPPPGGYRSRRPRKTRPVHAGSWWLKGLVILGVLALAALGIRVVIVKEQTEAARRTLLSLEPGECVSTRGDVALNDGGVAFRDLDVVSCTKPHSGEVIFVDDYPAGALMPYDTDGTAIRSFTPAAAAWVQLNCFDAFTNYVGRPPLEQSQYDLGWVMPGPKLWSSGTRRSACFVTNLDHSLLSHPIKGTMTQ